MPTNEAYERLMKATRDQKAIDAVNDRDLRAALKECAFLDIRVDSHTKLPILDSHFGIPMHFYGTSEQFATLARLNVMGQLDSYIARMKRRSSVDY